MVYISLGLATFYYKWESQSLEWWNVDRQIIDNGQFMFKYSK